MTRRQQHISHIKTYQLFLTCIGSSPARGYEGVVGLPLRLKWSLGWDPAPPPSGRRVPLYPHHLYCLRHPKRPSPQGGQSTHARMHECVHGIGLSQLKFQTCYPTVQDHKSHTQINTYATHNQSIIYSHTPAHMHTLPPPTSPPSPLSHTQTHALTVMLFIGEMTAVGGELVLGIACTVTFTVVSPLSPNSL